MNIVRKCQDLYGELSPSNQKLLQLMLSNPSEDTWFRARKIVVNPAPLITLEMAVKRVSNSSIREIPDPFTIYRALKYSIDKGELFKSRSIGTAY